MDVVSPEADNDDGISDIAEGPANSENDEGTSPDLLSRLTWDKDLNIYQRLILAQQDAKPIAKTKGQNGMKYDFIAHDDVTDRAKAALGQHGILFFPSIEEMTQDANRTTVKVRCDMINADKPEEKLETIGYGYGNDNQDKGPGKAYSYAVKYALQKALMLNTGEDIETHSIEYTPADRAQKTEEEVKAWRREIFMQIKNTTSYEQLKQIKTDNLPMLNSKIVPEETRKAIVEKIDGRLDELKEVLLQDEAANASS
jgi:hypothetical protein